MSWIRRETEKETVQYICPHCHDYHEFREDFGERTFSENYIFCRRCGARNGTGNAPALTQPNEPLTLEQLREMNGEPVWVTSARERGNIPSRWVLFAGVSKSKRNSDVFVFATTGGIGQGYEAVNYGKTWNAYRRPPEGEA